MVTNTGVVRRGPLSVTGLNRSSWVGVGVKSIPFPNVRRAFPIHATDKTSTALSETDIISIRNCFCYQTPIWILGREELGAFGRSVFCSGHTAAPASPHPLINSQMSVLTKHHSHPLTSLTPRAAIWLSEELLHVRDLCLNRTEQKIVAESTVLMNHYI